jgi:lactoylglutathione lyase
MDYKAWLYGMNSTAPRFLHTAVRIRDIEASLRFYVEGLGMVLLDRVEIESFRVTALFIGYGINEGLLELVHYWDGDAPYQHSPGYIHAAVGVPDLGAILNRLTGMGVRIARPPAVIAPGAPPAAFLHDPDGYELELVQTCNTSSNGV